MSTLSIYKNYTDLGIYARSITQGEEIDMVRDFISFRIESFKSNESKQLAVFLETRISNAFPDILFVEYNPLNYKRWNELRSVFSPLEIKILYYILKNRNTTSDKIANGLSIDYRKLMHSLELLLDANVIERRNHYWRIANKETLFGVKSIEAVEAKIGKWDIALQQAIQDSLFASESFILSKIKNKPNESTVQKLNEFGIGIYLYNTIEFSRYTKAKHYKYPNNYNSLLLNEYIGRVLNNRGEI